MSETPDPVVKLEPQGDPDALGDAGKRALTAEREARAAAEKSASDLQARLDALEAEKLSELEKAQLSAKTAADKAVALEADVAAKDLLILKQRIGGDEKLPPDLISRLQGDTEDAIREDAKKLAVFVLDGTPSPFPKADPSQGAKGATAGGTNAERFATFMESKLT